MITIHFSDDDRLALEHERYNHPHPFVQRKMEVLWLKSQGVSHKEIGRLANVSPATLITYLREYQGGGVEALKTLNFRRPTSDLDEHRTMLEEHVRKNPPASTKAAMAEIERLTGLKRSPESVRRFMIRIGMKCRKIGMVPAQANIKAQDDFKKKSWSRVWRTQRPENARFSSSMRHTSS